MKTLTIYFGNLESSKFFGSGAGDIEDNAPDWIEQIGFIAQRDKMKIDIRNGWHIETFEIDGVAVVGHEPEYEWFEKASQEAWEIVNP